MSGALPGKRTFIDSGVLIAAFRGGGNFGERALAVLQDQEREFITSVFVRLEVLPKPVAYGRSAEQSFYRTYFAAVKRMVPASRELIELAQSEAESFGLSAIDALHVAAAKRSRCHEFITTEGPTKPLFRVRGLQMTSIESN